MTVHTLPLPPQTAVDRDEAIAIQDLLNDALIMADITALMVCECFDSGLKKQHPWATTATYYETSELRANHMVFAVCEVFKRLKQIDTQFRDNLVSRL